MQYDYPQTLLWSYVVYYGVFRKLTFLTTSMGVYQSRWNIEEYETDCPDEAI